MYFLNQYNFFQDAQSSGVSCQSCVCVCVAAEDRPGFCFPSWRFDSAAADTSVAFIKRTTSLSGFINRLIQAGDPSFSLGGEDHPSNPLSWAVDNDKRRAAAFLHTLFYLITIQPHGEPGMRFLMVDSDVLTWLNIFIDQTNVLIRCVPLNMCYSHFLGKQKGRTWSYASFFFFFCLSAIGLWRKITGCLHGCLLLAKR